MWSCQVDAVNCEDKEDNLKCGVVRWMWSSHENKGGDLKCGRAKWMLSNREDKQKDDLKCGLDRWMWNNHKNSVVLSGGSRDLAEDVVEVNMIGKINA